MVRRLVLGKSRGGSWSSTLERDDRTRITDAGSRRRSWTKQARKAVVLAVAGGAFFVVFAEVALADSDPSGTTAAQNVATGPSTAYTKSKAYTKSPVLIRETTTSTNPSGSSETSDTTQAEGDDLDGLVDSPIDPGDAPSSSVQLAETGALVDQTDAGNENVSVRVDQAGNSGTVSQGNDASATASSSASGNWPSTGSDPVASASAEVDQTSPSNTNIAVRVGSPGDIGDVNQSNTANADAAAIGSTGSAIADATADQTAPSNINVVVRVDSPGSNGSVDQENAVTATAGTGLASPATSTPGGGTTAGTAAASQHGALNANVSIRVGSPGSDGDVRQSNRATATGTSPAGGIVSVIGGSSLDVSVVLPGLGGGAPGGPVWQWNWEWNGAWTLPVGTNGGDVAPTDDSTWDWIWKVVSTGTTATAGTASSPTTPPSAPTTTPPSAQASPEVGSWTWNWTWVLLDGSTWSLNWNESCTCAWDWNWNWDWSDQAPSPALPTTTGSGAPSAPTTRAFDAAVDDGPVTQTNSVSAEATASVEVSAAQEQDQTQTGADPGLELQDTWAEQRILNAQTGVAVADATQIDPWNLNMGWGVPVASVLQSNIVEAVATAQVTAEVSQAVVQEQNGNDTTHQHVGAEQWTSNTQVARATAEAAQTSARNENAVSSPSPTHAVVAAVEQSNSASASASSTIDAKIAQWIGQFEDGGVAIVQKADATQLHVNAQDGTAVSVVGQTRTTNLNDVDVPNGSQATNPRVRQRNEVFTTATVVDTSAIDDWIHQVLAGAAEVELAETRQERTVEQSKLESSPASQSDRLNRATWRGVEPAADYVGGPDQAGGPDETRGPGPAAGPALTFGGSQESTTPATPQVETAESGSRGGAQREPVSGDPAGEGGQGKLIAPPTPSSGLGQSGPVAPGAGAPGTSQGSGSASRAVETLSATGAAQSENGSAQPEDGKRANDMAPPQRQDLPKVGTIGSAPPSGGGGGISVLTLGTYEFAVPARLGPQVSTPTFGRSVALPEPFEWPG